MKLREFKKLAAERGLMYDTSTWHACCRVLVDGDKPARAAKLNGIHQSNVTRALKKLTAELPHCPTCGKII